MKSILQPGVSPLSADEARALLERVVGRAGTLAPKSIVCFDLDSTVLNNAPRQARIMREYGEEHAVEALKKVSGAHWSGWDAKIPMRAVGLDDEAITTHFEPFRSYWRDRFFASDYCTDDEPLAGAPEYVNAVLATGTQVCYLTGRHEAMREGTLASLTNGDFPVPDEERIRLIMKPKLEEHDDAYKIRTYETLRNAGEVVAAFDNEPAHINGYFAAFPEALSIHLATDHSMRETLVSSGIPSISGFSSWLA